MNATARSLLPVLVAWPPLAAAQSPRPFPPAIAIQIPVPPAPIANGGARYLCYELHLTSYTGDTARVQRVEVFADSSGGRPLVSYEGAELAGNLGRPGLSLEPDQRPALGPAVREIGTPVKGGPVGRVQRSLEHLGPPPLAAGDPRPARAWRSVMRSTT